MSADQKPRVIAGIAVRPADITDAAQISAVEARSWRAAYAGLMPDAYLDELGAPERAIARWQGALARDASRGRCTVLAEAGGSVAGYAVVGPDDGSSDALVHLLYVRPDCWGMGVGRALMQRSHEWFAERGYGRAALWVLHANDRARRFYEHDGWRADGAVSSSDYGGVSLTAMRMVRDLSAG